MFLLFILLSSPLSAETFRFEYRDGEKYRTVTTVDENVYINGAFSHNAEILNKVAVEITQTKEDSGLLQASFQISERSSGSSGVYSWSQGYDSIFWRDQYGVYNIEPRFYMPVVRSVPTFPQRDVNEGETWSAPGQEVHDFRTNFNIEEPFAFPIHVTYKYVGKQEVGGIDLDVISIKYSVYHRTKQQYSISGMYPVRLSGYSEQTLYWDNLIGRPHSYEEQFEFVFDMSNGTSVTYIGTAEGEVIESPKMDRAQMERDIKKRLEDEGVTDTDVRSDEKGVTISLENIQFLPDSAVLRESEKEKLRKIAGILETYSNRDVLITGHTALAGTARGRQTLSEQRAKAVGDYLLALGTKEADEIITRGMAAREPIADNSTPEGMRKNRRVEITILEN